jgi:hypothetical protein
VAVGAGAVLSRAGERGVAEAAGAAFASTADDATLLSLKKAPELAGDLGKLEKLPRTAEMREIYLKKNPDLALDIGRYLERENPRALEMAIDPLPTSALNAFANDLAEKETAAQLKEEAYNTAEKIAHRLGTINPSDTAKLDDGLRSLQSTLPSGTKVSLAGNGPYVRIEVNNGLYSYEATVDLVTVGAATGGALLTHEVFSRRGFQRLPDKVP